jgi:uncharacterized membrane protein YfbV (UPF0208 family)
MTSTFLKDLIERAVKTGVQVLLGFFLPSVTVFSVDWDKALAVTGTAVLVSVLTSLISFKLSDNGTASLVPEVVDIEHPVG